MSIYKNKNLLALRGKLFKFPMVLVNYIADIFSHGWDRNRALDSIGTHNNALMGGYLLAASNTVIAITGILTTDTIVPLTSGGNVGTVTVNGTISFTTGNKYGAFEVYRGTTRIGRYCLTERQGLQIINQITGGLTNGLLGGTTTTIWQRSNAFYSETNERGYSVAGTGWVTNAGAAIAVGALVPADMVNPTKCLAWVGGVQQDLQNVGRAKNSISVVPYATYCNGDRYWIAGNFATQNTTSLEYTVYITPQNTTGTGFIVGQLYSDSHSIIYAGVSRVVGITIGVAGKGYFSDALTLGTSYKIVAGFINNNVYMIVIDLKTGYTYTKNWNDTHTDVSSAPFYIASANNGTFKYIGYLTGLRLTINGVLKLHAVQDQHSTNLINTATGVIMTANGITANLLQNIDLGYNQFNQTGYELWTNGSDYRIYPLASDGTRIITPAGYTIVETVTAGNMPSDADSRFTTFKYALANSYAVRNSVPEAYNADEQATPKMLTYAELSALSSNIKVTKTEVNGKITNITIRQ